MILRLENTLSAEEWGQSLTPPVNDSRVRQWALEERIRLASGEKAAFKVGHLGWRIHPKAQRPIDRRSTRWERERAKHDR